MIDGSMVMFKFNIDGFLEAFKGFLEFGLRPYEKKMKSRVARARKVPGSWISTIQGAIDIEVSGGGMVIQAKIGIINRLPYHMMMQGFIMNVGSGQFGENGMIHGVYGAYLNVHTGGSEMGSFDPNRIYPQFGKVGVRWFDEVEAQLKGTGRVQEIVDTATRKALAHIRRGDGLVLKGKTKKVTFTI